MGIAAPRAQLWEVTAGESHEESASCPDFNVLLAVPMFAGAPRCPYRDAQLLRATSGEGANGI